MAEKKEDKKSTIRKSETVRERSQKAQAPKQPRRLRTTAGKVGTPLRKAASFGKREYYLPMPDNRVGRFLNKRRSVIPRFLRESWQELRQVTWTTRRETWKLTVAVFLFALIFGTLIALTDFGLDKLFRKVILQ